jgi:hypothetical protein
MHKELYQYYIYKLQIKSYIESNTGHDIGCFFIKQGRRTIYLLASYKSVSQPQ